MTRAHRPPRVPGGGATVIRPPWPTPANRGAAKRTRAFATTSASGAYSVSAARSPAASSVSACRAMACIWSGRPAATGWAPGTPTRRVCVTHAASTANAKDAARLIPFRLVFPSGLERSPEIVGTGLTAIQALQHGPAQERDQNLVVSGELDAAPAALRGSLHDVDARAVVALHVAVARREPGGFPAAQVARHRERLQEHLRHDDGAAQVEHHAAVVERRQDSGEEIGRAHV